MSKKNTKTEEYAKQVDNMHGSSAMEEVYSTLYKEGEQEEVNTLLDMFDKAYEQREQPSIIFNDIPYSRSYAYNQRKAINWTPPAKKKGDKMVNSGMIHEKIIGFSAIFLKYVWKKHITCYKDGQVVPQLGDFYELAIDFSYKMEEFKKKIGLIYWELFSQGDCFVLEDWVVETKRKPVMKDSEGNVIKEEDMDYTYEFLEDKTFEDGKEFQTRKAISRVLDGRNVILGDIEVNDIQDQPFIVIEEEYDHDQAKAMFGTLSKWDAVPKSDEAMQHVLNDNAIGQKIFNGERVQPTEKIVCHRYFNKTKNRFNIFLNGVMMLPLGTRMNIFYPRGNYPITQVAGERVRGSSYSRSVPAKTKFNADFVDWALRSMAEKFEQGMYPAILSKGKYTLASDMFRARKVTHGVERKDYELANPDQNGITQADFSFVQAIRELVESQTLNKTSSGEISGNATATEIAMADQAQQEQLGYLLDGIMYGMMDMALRRAETIESKYTLKQKEVDVDGRKMGVYHNFNLNVAGIQNVVVFDDRMSDIDYTETQKEKDQYALFEEAQKSKKRGSVPSKYFVVNPKDIRENRYIIDIEIRPDKQKNSQLQMMQMWDEFGQAMKVFGRQVNLDEVKKEYLEVSGRSEDFFLAPEVLELQEQEQALAQQEAGSEYQMGQFGGAKPNISNAVKDNMLGRQQ